MFGTALSYVTMRLLGVEADAPEIVRAREWVSHGVRRLGGWDWGGCVVVVGWGVGAGGLMMNSARLITNTC